MPVVVKEKSLSSSYLRLEQQTRDVWGKQWVFSVCNLRWFQTSMGVRLILKEIPELC